MTYHCSSLRRNGKMDHEEGTRDMTTGVLSANATRGVSVPAEG